MFVSILAVQCLVRGLESSGVEDSELFLQLRTTWRQKDPWDVIDVDVLRPMLDTIATDHGSGVFLEAGLGVSIAEVPIIGELFLAGRTLSHGGALVHRYRNLWSDANDLSVRQADGGWVVVQMASTVAPTLDGFTAFSFGVMLRALEAHTTPGSVATIWLDVDAGAPPSGDGFRDAEILSAAGRWAVRVARPALAVEFATPASGNAGIIERIAASLVTGQAEETAATVALRYIATNLHRYDLNIRSFSRSQTISVRTAQRRLAASGARFEDLVDDVRRDTATRLLHRTTLGLDEIAAALGYQSTQGFIRAHARWTGMTPTAWRRQSVDTDVSPIRRTA